MRKNLLMLLMAFSLLSCKKDEPVKPAESTLFKVEKTQTNNIDYRGGGLQITTNQEGVTAHSEGQWLQAQVSGKVVQLTVSPNDGYESRTTLVTLTWGQQTQSVPITQMGVISIVEVYSHDFPGEGGEKGFLWQTDRSYEITDIDNSWLTYEIREDSIFFKAAPLGDLDDSRSNKVKVKVGALYNKEVVFQQFAPAIPYSLIPGKYTLEYKESVTKKVQKMDVELVEKEKKKSLILKGIGLDIEVLYDRTRGITIQSQVLDRSNFYMLLAWDGQSDAISSGSDMGVVSDFNGDKRNIVFTMVSNGAVDNAMLDKTGNPAVVRGFLISGLLGEKGLDKVVKSTRLVDMKLIKKRGS